MTDLIKTKWRLILPGGLDSREFGGDLEREPSYKVLKVIMDPLLGGELEHVSVLADYASGDKYVPLDMFVHETGALDGFTRNEEATMIYRRNWLTQHPEVIAEDMPAIHGPAVLFDRRVWF